MSKFFFETALLTAGWRDNVSVSVNAAGIITAVQANSDKAGHAFFSGAALPGIPNLHSHAHQRAMAGLAERAGPGLDSFWTWRELMYRFIDNISPDDLAAIAAQLYVEMLKAGYTTVGEFHYLHHSPDGTPYANSAEMAERILAAAEQTGIGMTCLPVLYRYGGFGGQTPNQEQRRFICEGKQFLKLFEQILTACQNNPNHAAGIAPHSLRAVTPELLQQVISTARQIKPDTPLHIHIAEQTQEVDDCIAWSKGQRPVEWLLDHCDIDANWCLIHATHLSESETARLATSSVVVGLCPTTEANLGDGLFPAKDFLQAGGRIGIGSDSNSSVSPVEEIRLLEYGQRLQHQGRNILSASSGRSTGRTLFEAVSIGGRQALGRKIGAIEVGYQADLIVLDTDNAILCDRREDAILDSWLFAGNTPCVSDVIVGGQQVIQAGHHANEEQIFRRYKTTLARLLG